MSNGAEKSPLEFIIRHDLSSMLPHLKAVLRLIQASTRRTKGFVRSVNRIKKRHSFVAGV
jgi:hypothetical protein